MFVVADNMADNKALRERLQRIGDLILAIESIADPAVRANARELVQLVMDLHGAALEQAMEIVADAGEPGMSLIDKLGRDPLVSSLLVLYGLHPEDVDTRILQAIEKVKPSLRKQGCEVEVLGLAEGSVRLRVQTGEHACGSTAKTVQAMLEEAIYDAAPDVAAIAIEGLEGKTASGFVGVDKLLSIAVVPQVVASADSALSVSKAAD